MKKYIFITIAFALGIAGVAVANPSQFQKYFSDSNGSTLLVPTYTTAGNATSTVTLYSPITPANVYNSATVQFMVKSTTTPPTVYFRVENSYDNSTWFAYDNATSTGALAPTVHTFTFASTTYSTYALGDDSTENLGSFKIDVTAPYTRVVAYSRIGNPAYDFFMSIVPTREVVQ